MPSTTHTLGPAVLINRAPLDVDEWTEVTIERNLQDGKLTVDGEPVSGESFGPSSSLNLGTPFFIGGLAPGVALPEEVQFAKPFRGCISNPVMD